MGNRKLTDTQLVVLAEAAARDTGLVLPVPSSLRVNAGTLAIVLRSLLSRNLILERAASEGEAVWAKRDEGRPVTLVISEPGLAAMGVDRVAGTKVVPSTVTQGRTPNESTSAPADVVRNSQPARESKLGGLVAALRREGGASISHLTEATGWQAHSVRGAISGVLKKKFGLRITSERLEGRGRVYRIEGQAE